MRIRARDVLDAVTEGEAAVHQAEIAYAERAARAGALRDASGLGTQLARHAVAEPLPVGCGGDALLLVVLAAGLRGGACLLLVHRRAAGGVRIDWLSSCIPHRWL